MKHDTLMGYFCEQLSWICQDNDITFECKEGFDKVVFKGKGIDDELVELDGMPYDQQLAGLVMKAVEYATFARASRAIKDMNEKDNE